MWDGQRICSLTGKVCRSLHTESNRIELLSTAQRSKRRGIILDRNSVIKHNISLLRYNCNDQCRAVNTVHITD